MTVDAGLEAAVPKMTLAVPETDVKIAETVVETPIANAVAEAMLVPVVLPAARRRTEIVNAIRIGETLAREKNCADGTDVIAMTDHQKWAVLPPLAAMTTRMKAVSVHHPLWVHHLLRRRHLHLPFPVMRTTHVVGAKVETAATVQRIETVSVSAVSADASAMDTTVIAAAAPRIASVAGPTTPRTMPEGMQMAADREWAAITSVLVAGSDRLNWLGYASAIDLLPLLFL